MNIHTPTDHVQLNCLVDGTLTTNTTAGVDTRTFTRALAILEATTSGASTVTNATTLQEAPDNATWTNITGATIATIPASQNQAIATVNVYLPIRKRYLRWNYTITGTVVGSIWILLFNSQYFKCPQPSQVVTPINV